MTRLFFTLCALCVSVVGIYHYFPASAKIAYVAPINGAGVAISYLAFIGLGLSVIYWRMLGKSHK